LPSNVSRDAKYSVVHGPDEMRVRLEFQIDRRVRALLTTDAHPELVEKVNKVKTAHGGAPGGAFYINEFFHVVVPTVDGSYYYGGTYDAPLEFDYEGQIVSPIAPPGLAVGDEWTGPHVGVAYVLTASSDDIYYRRTDGNLVRKYHLSDEVGAEAANALAKRLAVVKGTNGGRIYINECGEFFAPVQSAGAFLYLGHLGEDAWFGAPDLDEF
jgi:hypothetical protein